MCSQSVKELIKPPLRKASAKVGTFQITAKCFSNFFKKMKKKREKQGQKGEKGRKKAKKRKNGNKGRRKRKEGKEGDSGRKEGEETTTRRQSGTAMRHVSTTKRGTEGNGTEKRAKKTGLR
jgi:hypothetical protein